MSVVFIIISAIASVVPAPAVREGPRQIGPTTVLTTEAPTPAGLHCPEWYGAERAAGWDDDQVPNVDRIMFRESRCSSTATHRNSNGTIDRGLMQVNSIHLAWLVEYGISASDLLVGETNLVAARLLWERSGWAPWN